MKNRYAKFSAGCLLLALVASCAGPGKVVKPVSWKEDTPSPYQVKECKNQHHSPYKQKCIEMPKGQR